VGTVFGVTFAVMIDLTTFIFRGFAPHLLSVFLKKVREPQKSGRKST
jgi:hypothetical protein